MGKGKPFGILQDQDIKLDYHLALCYPFDMREAARNEHHPVLCAVGFSIPRVDEGRGVWSAVQKLPS